MRALIVEDEFTSRMILQRFLEPYGLCHIAKDGKEALMAIKLADDQGEPYDLVCLDVLMPELDGQEVLRLIREWEDGKGYAGNKMVKVVMTTALEDSKNVLSAFKSGCEAYLVKPITKESLLKELGKLELI